MLDSNQRPAVLLSLRAACSRRPPYEDNRVFEKANSRLTIRLPVNDHRAALSMAQRRSMYTTHGVRKKRRAIAPSRSLRVTSFYSDTETTTRILRVCVSTMK
jgi:hypothetical protein